MVELELRGRGKPVGSEPARCKMTIQRAELPMPSALIASLRHQEPAFDAVIVNPDVEVLEVEPGGSTARVVTFDLEDAAPVGDAGSASSLEEHEMAVVIEAASRDEPLVGVVEAPDS